jgi:hypothetical protein
MDDVLDFIKKILGHLIKHLIPYAVATSFSLTTLVIYFYQELDNAKSSLFETTHKYNTTQTQLTSLEKKYQIIKDEIGDLEKRNQKLTDDLNKCIKVPGREFHLQYGRKHYGPVELNVGDRVALHFADHTVTTSIVGVTDQGVKIKIINCNNPYVRDPILCPEDGDNVYFIKENDTLELGTSFKSCKSMNPVANLLLDRVNITCKKLDLINFTTIIRIERI